MVPISSSVTSLPAGSSGTDSIVSTLGYLQHKCIAFTRTHRFFFSVVAHHSPCLVCNLRLLFLTALWFRVTDQGGPGVPDVMTQAKILYDNWVLDIPKILDVCSIYSTDNRELVVGFLKKVFFLQPKYLEDLAGLVSVLVENLHELELSCWNIMPETQMGSPEVLASWPGEVIKWRHGVLKPTRAVISWALFSMN